MKRNNHFSRGSGEKKPLFVWLIVFIGLALAVLAQTVLGSSRSEVEPAVLQPSILQNAAESPIGAPSTLQSAIESLAATERGRNGVLVRSVDDGWVAGYRGAMTFSQGTTRRIWLGAALLGAVDYGELTLDQRVPLLAVKPKNEQPRARLGDLLRQAIAGDDRTSQDHILDGLSGPSGIARWLEEKEIDEVAYGSANRDFARIIERNGAHGASGLRDGATPDGMAFGLSELYAGKLLSGNSTRMLLGYFTSSQAGRDVMKPGWQILRMTGETTTAGGQVVGASGVALVRSRFGRRSVVAVFADGPAEAVDRRDRLLSGALAALEQNEVR